MFSKSLALCLATAVALLPVSLTYAQVDINSHADNHAHEGHQLGSADAGLRLDNGSQWQTDAPLRTAMAALRNEIHPLMASIHQDQLAVSRYQALAASVNAQVSYMIEHCELDGDADAQLHLIIADMLAAARLMQGDAQGQPRRDGAIGIVGALNNYATYFDHPGFELLGH